MMHGRCRPARLALASAPPRETLGERRRRKSWTPGERTGGNGVEYGARAPKFAKGEAMHRARFTSKNISLRGFLVVGVVSAGLAACSSGDERAAPGTKGGACYPNGTCDDGLSCASDLCVALGGADDDGKSPSDDGAKVNTTKSPSLGATCKQGERATDFASCTSDDECFSGNCCKRGMAGCGKQGDYPGYCVHPNTTAYKSGHGYSCDTDADCAAVAPDFIARGGRAHCYKDNVNDVPNGCGFDCSSPTHDPAVTSNGGSPASGAGGAPGIAGATSGAGGSAQSMGGGPSGAGGSAQSGGGGPSGAGGSAHGGVGGPSGTGGSAQGVGGAPSGAGGRAQSGGAGGPSGVAGGTSSAAGGHPGAGGGTSSAGGGHPGAGGGTQSGGGGPSGASGASSHT